MSAWHSTYPELTAGVGSLRRRAEGGEADKRNDPTKVVYGDAPEDKGIAGLIRKGWRAAMETPLYPNSPTTLGDAAPGMLQGARFIPTGVGDVAELTNLGINMRDPEYRAQLREPPILDTSDPLWPLAKYAGHNPAYLLSMLNQPQMEGLGALLPIVPGMTTWHGSPHKFSRFKASQIGTGEGSQVKGWGLYFAENRKVAGTYASHANRTIKYKGQEILQNNAANATGDQSLNEILSAYVYVDDLEDTASIKKILRERRDYLNKEMIEEGIYVTESRAHIADIDNALLHFDEYIKDIDAVSTGALYEVDIPDEEIAKMLDWDAPLGEGSEVSNKIMRLAEDHPKIDVEDIEDALGILEGYRGDSVSGQELYGLISSSVGGDKAASLALNEAGIPGIKYYDQGSRTAGEGTRNFVVFDEDLPKIIKTE